MTEQERTLIAGCVKSDKAAWDSFVEQYSALVYHTIRKTFVTYHVDLSPDSADDLYQEFFLAILRDDFRKLRQFKGDRGCTLASWLRVVAARLTIDYLRSEKTQKIEISDNVPGDEPETLDSAIEEEQAQALFRVLETLPAKDRILIDLYYRQNLSPEEIAKILRVSVSAVYTQNSRLKAKLREILRKSGSL